MIAYRKVESEKAILIGLARDFRQKRGIEESLDELARLTYSAGAQVVGRRIQTRPKADAAFYIC